MKVNLSEQNKIQKAILNCIQNDAKTILQITAEINYPAEEIFWHVNALRKYNKIQEEKRKGDYLFYKVKGI